MANLIYMSSVDDLCNGNIDFGSDTFKVMLVTSSYTPNQDTHNRRDDVTNEVVGTNYTAGGTAVTVTVTLDTSNNRVDVSFTDVTWPLSTLTARGAVVYKSRGGASSADELVCYFDFAGNITTSGGTFTIDFTGPYRFSVP